MDDIVERLRRDAKQEPLAGWLRETLAEAADEIERLRAEIARMREWDPVINAVQADRDRLRAALERIEQRAHEYGGPLAAWITNEIRGLAVTGSASPQAPIARVYASNEGCHIGYELEVLSPGLPIGVHDLYCVPASVAPSLPADAAPTVRIRYSVRECLRCGAQWDADRETCSTLACIAVQPGASHT